MGMILAKNVSKIYETGSKKTYALSDVFVYNQMVGNTNFLPAQNNSLLQHFFQRIAAVRKIRMSMVTEFLHISSIFSDNLKSP